MVAMATGASLAAWGPRLPALMMPLQDAALEEHMRQIERMTADGGVMMADNARYAAEDGGQTHYGQHFEKLPGGMSAKGCLWGEKDGEVVGVYWYFFAGWDPGAQRGFFYQSGARGFAGMGHGGADGPDGHWLEQRFSGKGMPARLRHEDRWFGTDSVSMRSFAAEEGGDWEPRRSYTWVRVRREAPC